MEIKHVKRINLYWKSPSFSINNVLSSFKFRHFIRFRYSRTLRFLGFGFQIEKSVFGLKSPDSKSVGVFRASVFEPVLSLLNNNGIWHFWQRAVSFKNLTTCFWSFWRFFVTSMTPSTVKGLWIDIQPSHKVLIIFSSLKNSTEILGNGPYYSTLIWIIFFYSLKDKVYIWLFWF